jgi:hypothetical protein
LGKSASKCFNSYTALSALQCVYTFWRRSRWTRKSDSRKKIFVHQVISVHLLNQLTSAGVLCVSKKRYSGRPHIFDRKFITLENRGFLWILKLI